MASFTPKTQSARCATNTQHFHTHYYQHQTHSLKDIHWSKFLLVFSWEYASSINFPLLMHVCLWFLSFYVKCNPRTHVSPLKEVAPWIQSGDDKKIPLPHLSVETHTHSLLYYVDLSYFCFLSKSWLTRIHLRHKHVMIKIWYYIFDDTECVYKHHHHSVA